jgi:NAD(P)-dependent dehydrogenase (short-subunit alcohol dehydrogenase family)
MNHASSLRGARVAVTGGTSGLGLALVHEIAARGSRVGFVARTADRVQAVARETGAFGIAADVADKRDIHRIALQVAALLGGVDVLVNNASTLGPAPLRLLADTECEDFASALTTNVLGPFRLTRALMGSLAASARDGRGAVVLNIGSDAGVNAYAQWGAYGASKAALAHMARIWDEESAPFGVRMLCIDPGDMDTPMHAAALPDADRATLARPPDVARTLCDRIAVELARIAQGDEALTS